MVNFDAEIELLIMESQTHKLKSEGDECDGQFSLLHQSVTLIIDIRLGAELL